MAKWWIGCSGFHYNHWKEIFYPTGLPKNKWFLFYCEHFKTLELNVTFYRFPQLSFLQGWYKKSSPDFTFAVKAPRAITHYKKFNGTEKMMSDFYATIHEGLQEKLGCVLFQLPPQLAYSHERLQKFINCFNPSFNNVLEFRHSSWWNQEVYHELSKNKISFCGMSHPDLPDEIIQNTSILYYRMHGLPELYKSAYKIAALNSFVKKVESSGKIKKAFIYFNNDIDGSAIKNAREMNEIIS